MCSGDGNMVLKFSKFVLQISPCSGGPRNFSKPGQTCLICRFLNKIIIKSHETQAGTSSASLGGCPGWRDATSAPFHHGSYAPSQAEESWDFIFYDVSLLIHVQSPAINWHELRLYQTIKNLRNRSHAYLYVYSL
jgi:hypothetical protein